MITAERVRELAAIRASGHVVSCYLDVDGARFPRRADYEHELAAMARAARGRVAGLDADDARSVGDDIDRIVAWVEGGFERSGVRGLACFAASADGLFEVVKLPTPPVNHLWVGRAPMVAPLELVVEHAEPCVVVLSDRSRARCFSYQLGALVELDELVDALPRGSEHQARPESHQQRHTDEVAHRHLRRVADFLLEREKAGQGAPVLLGGPAAVISELERLLHPSVARRLAGRTTLAVSASSHEVREAAAAAELAVERERERTLVERLRGAVGTGNGAVAGLAPTLTALAERRVGTLLASEGFEAPGWRCAACDSLREMGPGCPSCGAGMERVDDVVGDAVGLALASGCSVTIARGNADLDVLGRIGALLRY